MMRPLHLARRLALAGLMAVSAASPALAKDDDGIEITIKVLDLEGNPIPTAVVRHPDEEFRHRVNTFDGSWSVTVLYMPDGSELRFDKGDEVEFEISAPGYINERFVYIVKKRKNVVPVTLQAMDFSGEEDAVEDPVIQFGRDKPVDGMPVDPAN